MKHKKVIILVNLGTPDIPTVSSVRKYLREFLSDPRVIDIHPWIRFILVNFIIAPFRSFKSAKLYKRLWTEEGSPLLANSMKLCRKLSITAGNDYDVFPAMRYGKPSLTRLLNSLKEKNYLQIILVPLFPQYASSTTGSITANALRTVSEWNVVPDIRVIGSFYNKPQYVHAISSQLKDHDPGRYDHVLFSFHGLPLRQVYRMHQDIECSQFKCDQSITEQNRNCYRASCYHSARLIAAEAGLEQNKFSVAFQSRFTRKWLGPFTDDTIRELAQKGIDRLLVICPSFVADCLETIVETGHEYKKLFLQNGGKEFTLVKSLNDDDRWSKGLFSLILSK